MTSFHRVNKIFRNVDKFKISNKLIGRFGPVVEIRKTSASIFRMLEDELDDSTTDLRIAVWRLKATIELSTLPFNSDALQLGRLFEEIQTFSKYYPTLIPYIEKLGELVGWLLENPNNPKLNELTECVNSLEAEIKIGVAARLVRGSVPGWDESGWSSFQALFPKCKKIISVATLRKDLFDLIIVPSGGISVPFRRELFTSFVAPEILFISYDCESRFSYQPPKLPLGSMSFKFHHKLKEKTHVAITASETVIVDDWFDRNFWELTRIKLLKTDGHSESSIDERFKVKSRLALLGAKKGIYFREDHKVIEISDLIEGRVDIDDFGNKYPRKTVQELRRGSLVVLRTAGSGDALDDVSTSLMMTDDKFDLIESSCEWKAFLLEALEQHGPEIVATMLARRGHQIREPNYLWMWTTKTVIKPESKSTFIDLIKVVKDLGYEFASDHPETYASKKWEQMQELISYRRKASRKIREALLQMLQEFIKSGIQIEDEHNISLAGVGGGELTIFRISGMDNTSQAVPYSKTGIVASVET